MTTAQSAAAAGTTSPAARRGRPPQTEEDIARAREAIIDATAEVFAEHGSRGLSVALIIETAAIARPTFYRYFANAGEPLAILLDRSDADLIDGVVAAITGATTAPEMAVTVVDAYLAWARERGATLCSIFREIYEPQSPVYERRARALAVIRDTLAAKLEVLGRTPPDELEMDTLINTFQFVGYRIALGDDDPGIRERGRMVMIRVAAAMLGSSEDIATIQGISGR